MDDDSERSVSFPSNRSETYPSYQSVENVKDYDFLRRIRLVPDEESVDDVEEPEIASDGNAAEERVKEGIENFRIDGLTVFKPLGHAELLKAARGDYDLYKLIFAQCTNSKQRIVVNIVGVQEGNPLEPYFVVEVKGFNLKDGELYADVHKDLLGILRKEYDWKLKPNDYNSEQMLAAAVVQAERDARMIYNRVLPLSNNNRREVAAFVCFMDTSGEKRHIYLYLRFIFKGVTKVVYVTPIRYWATVRDKMKSLTDNNKPALPQEWTANGFGKDSCAFIASRKPLDSTQLCRHPCCLWTANGFGKDSCAFIESPKKDYVYKVLRRTVTAYTGSDDIKREKCDSLRDHFASVLAWSLCIIIGVATLYHYWRGHFVSLLAWPLCIIIGVATLYHYWRGHFVSLLALSLCIIIGIEDPIQRLEGREDELETVYDLMNEYFDDKLIESLFHREPGSIKSMEPILSTRFHDRWRRISGLVIYKIPFHVSLGYKLRSLDEGMKLETVITVDSALPALADICLSYLLAGPHYPAVDVRPANLRLVGEVFRFMDWGETWASYFSNDIKTKGKPLNLILCSKMRSTLFKNNLSDNYKKLQREGGEWIVNRLIEEMESLCESQCAPEVTESIKEEIVKLGEDLIDEIRKIIDLIDIDEYFKV